MNYEQWLEERKYGIGGSECSAILGINPWMTNAELWEYKTGAKQHADISDKARVHYGKEVERHLIEIFKLDYPEYEVIHNEYDLRRCQEYPFIFGSLDSDLIEKETGRKGILEVKSSLILNSNEWEKWNNKIPDYYYSQLVQYFIVNPDKEFAILKAQLTSEKYNDDNFKQVTHSTRHYLFEKNEAFKEDIEYLKNEEINFWNNYVLTNKRPPLKMTQI